MRRTGGHQHPAPFQRSIRQRALDGRDDLQRFGHAARSVFATGHVALVRTDDHDAVTAQRGEVALRGRVVPHAHVHRRGDHDRRVSGHQQGRRQVVRVAPCHLRHEVRGRRCHHHEVRHAGQLDMAHLRLAREVEEVGVHVFPGQGGHAQRRHEFGGRAGHDRCHGGAALSQAPDQVQRLVGGNTAADDQQDPSARQHPSPFPMS